MPGKGRPFRKGQVTNPNGRPKKGTSLTELMRRFLERKTQLKDKSGNVPDLTNKELFIQTCLLHAIGGDPAFSNQIWKYVEGEPTQKVEQMVAQVSASAGSFNTKQAAEFRKSFRDFMLRNA